MRRVAPDGLRAREMARGARQRRRVCSCAAKAVLTPPAQALQALLQSPGLHLGPCAHDGLSARLIERNGAFRFMFMSGFSPKQCGHMKTRAVVPRGEAVARIRAAVDARDEGAGICIVARSDARSVVSLEEALWRVQAFADAVCSCIAIAWQHLID